MQSKLGTIVDPTLLERVEKSTIEEYEKLNKKCDQVISKIKNRKKNRKR